MPHSQFRVLPLVLLLVTFKSAHCTEECSLCLDGSTITKPDYFVGITTPYVLNTCKELSNALLFVTDDFENCRNARALSALCGCPVAENACSICKGSQNITKPQQLLEGLVDFPNDYFDFLSYGLEVTCAFAESEMQRYDTEQAECLEQPFDDLRRYCGCPSEDGEESNECTLCPGGQIVPDESGVDMFINTGNEDRVSCEKAKSLAAKTENGTEVCNQIQRGSTVCGCPVPENACRLCKNGGEVTATGTFITTPNGERVQCESFEAQLHSFESNSIECTSLDDNYADECACSEPEVFVPCSICVGGDEVAFPEKEFEGFEGIPFFLEPTCGKFSELTLLSPENSQECRRNRGMAQFCGCKPRAENTCTICKGGDAMSNPFQEVVFTFGALEYPKEFQFDGIPYATCEIAASFFFEWYTEDDSLCYWNQLMRGQVCGCPDNSEIKALVWTQRCSGILSLSGSLLIIISIITKARNVRWSPYNQIVLGISFFDSLSSVAYIIGTSFTPKDLGLPGSIGNDATCGFQAWLFQIGIASVYYSVLLCVYFLLVVKYDWTERKFSKVAKWVHLGVGTLGLIMAFAVIPFASPDWRWCYLGTPPQTASWLPGVFFFIIPVALSILAMTVVTVIFVIYVQKAYRKTQSKSMKRTGKGKAKGQKRRSLASRTFWQSVWFLAVFYAVWPIQFAAFVIPTVPRNYWIYLLAAMFGPLQGFLNALVVFCRDRKSISKRAKKTVDRFSLQVANGGSGFFKASVRFVGGKEAKQTSEFPVANVEVAQLEIDVGQIERVVEEEQETPEGDESDESLDEGDESDESLDEIDERLLQHAMNSDLLNDDDRRHFRGSITIIQRRASIAAS